MSHFPYGYPFQGQPTQQPYSYQPYNAYPPPANGYGTQQPPHPAYPSQAPQAHHPPPYPPAADNYYSASQSAYDHNASHIPGLDTSSTSVPFPAPFNSSWDQGSYPTSAPSAPAPYSPRHPSAFYSPHDPAASYSPYDPSRPMISTPIAHPPPQVEAPVPQNPQLAAQFLPSNAAAHRKLESDLELRARSKEQPQAQAQLDDSESQDEGEISEDVFADIYDNAPTRPSGSHEPAAPPVKATGGEDTDGSDQEPNFYDTDLEVAPAARGNDSPGCEVQLRGSVKAAQQMERDHSRSYSPHLSPAELQQDQEPTSSVQVVKQAHDLSASQAVSSPAASQGAGVVANGGHVNESVAVSNTSGANPPRSFASVSEAFNEAKKAILKLLPHGIKYQTYIDEGFDEELVKALFTQLNLSMDLGPSTSQEPAAPSEKENQDASKQPSQSSQSSQTTAADAIAKKQEERKDRIARLLAEKKAKAAVASSNVEAAAQPTTASGSTSAGPAVKTTAPKTRAEMDLLLQQKMALIKARSAQKISQKTSEAKPLGNNVVQKSAAPQVLSTDIQSPAGLSSVSGSPLPSEAQSAPQDPTSKPATPQRPSSTVPTPGILALSSGSRGHQPLNVRKRPVAADFMDSPAPAAKRPMLANRQASSLVIHISDDEDEDDVEMEVDSPTEDSPPPIQQTTTLPKRGPGPAIRDYPPLTDKASTRQVSSPVPTIAGKTTSGYLVAKEKAIEELRRRIEEAEARAKAKPKKGSVTPQTPTTGDATPAEQATKPATPQILPASDAGGENGVPEQLLSGSQASATPEPLSNPAVADPQPQNEQRSGVTSAPVPVKSAKRLEKEERLRRMREAILKLEAEIDGDMDDGEVPSEESQNVAMASASVVDPEQPVVGPDSPKDISQAQSLDIETLDKATHEAEASADAFLASIANPSLENVSTGPQPLAEDHAASEVDCRPAEAVINPPTEHGMDRDDSSVAGSSVSDAYQPPEAQAEDHMEVSSKSSTPAVTALTSDSNALAPVQSQQANTTQSSQISEKGDIELGASTEQYEQAVETTREATGDSSQLLQTSFVPYESPLRYFRAYRFHPGYKGSVAGGLKSLTYSNRIDPKREMCPDEWEGNDCPRGNTCEFQHFQSIIAPDNEIILELGSSDEFSGDQKKEFNNELRVMVAQFQKSRVRDFKTIAQAIVDFRRQFIGDPSRILHLGGVSL